MLKRISRGKLTTLDMEVALMHGFNPRQNIIVPNVSWGIWDRGSGALHECDLIILSGSDYATEIEIKVSKFDLLRDKDKRHKHAHGMIRRFYYAVPDELEEVAKIEIPDRAGLITVSSQEIKGAGGFYYYRIRTVRECKINTSAEKWSEDHRMQLMRLGTMRILGLKQKVLTLKSKIDAKVDRNDSK